VAVALGGHVLFDSDVACLPSRKFKQTYNFFGPAQGTGNRSLKRYKKGKHQILCHEHMMYTRIPLLCF